MFDDKNNKIEQLCNEVILEYDLIVQKLLLILIKNLHAIFEDKKYN